MEDTIKHPTHTKVQKNGRRYKIFLKQFNLAENVPRRVVKRRGSNQDDTFAAAYLRQLLICCGSFGSEAMRLIYEYVRISFCSLFYEMVELAQ